MVLCLVLCASMFFTRSSVEPNCIEKITYGPNHGPRDGHSDYAEYVIIANDSALASLLTSNSKNSPNGVRQFANDLYPKNITIEIRGRHTYNQYIENGSDIWRLTPNSFLVEHVFGAATMGMSQKRFQEAAQRAHKTMRITITVRDDTTRSWTIRCCPR